MSLLLGEFAGLAKSVAPSLCEDTNSKWLCTTTNLCKVHKRASLKGVTYR